MKGSAPAVSIVVPTRNRPADLERCLAAMAGQSGLESFEILVVDDGSDDPDAIRDVVAAHSEVRLVRQKGAGPAIARNAGVRAARGDVVCFTDDDCRPEPEWAARLRRALGAGADAAGGSTVSGRPGDPFAEATEVIIEHLRWSDGEASGVAFAPSNNLASSRSLLLRLPFDETYPRASGEDRDWCARLRKDGGSIVVVPEAVVHHLSSTGILAFWRQHVRYGRGAYRLARRREPTPGLQSPSFYARLLRGGFSRSFRCGVLVAVAQLATATGFVKEAWGLRKRRSESRIEKA